jgi:hypothetical protein
MFANQLFLELEIIHAYGPSLAAAALGSATVIWQTTSGMDSIKHELNAEISEFKVEMKADISRIDRKLAAINGDMLAIVRESTAAVGIS